MKGRGRAGPAPRYRRGCGINIPEASTSDSMRWQGMCRVTAKTAWLDSIVVVLDANCRSTGLI